MKKVVFMGLLVLISSQLSYGQMSDAQSIEKAIIGFSKAGDTYDTEALEKYLDPNYRIIMNQLFGSKELSIMSRNVYLEKIRTKVFGGDNRKLTFNAVLINSNTASVKVTMEGKKATFISILQLLKNSQGEWKLISDMPTVL